MNKELLEILLQFFTERHNTAKLKNICTILNCICIHCQNCPLARYDKVSFKLATKLDQIQITLKAVTDE